MELDFLVSQMFSLHYLNTNILFFGGAINSWSFFVLLEDVKLSVADSELIARLGLSELNLQGSNPNTFITVQLISIN